MNLEIIRPNGDLKREVWNFNLNVGWTGSPCIYFSYYSFQARDTTQHKWVKHTHWDRLRRDNNIDSPPLPSDVEAEARAYFQKQVGELPIGT